LDGNNLSIASYAELGAAVPETGGANVYIRRVYGNLPSFLYTWTIGCVVNPASTAAVSIILGEYITRIVLAGQESHASYAAWIQTFFSLLSIWTVICINSLGTNWALLLNYACTVPKLLGVGAVSLLGIAVIGNLELTLPN